MIVTAAAAATGAPDSESSDGVTPGVTWHTVTVTVPLTLSDPPAVTDSKSETHPSHSDAHVGELPCALLPCVKRASCMKFLA
jgi:hypothetical protein